MKSSALWLVAAGLLVLLAWACERGSDGESTAHEALRGPSGGSASRSVESQESQPSAQRSDADAFFDALSETKHARYDTHLQPEVPRVWGLRPDTLLYRLGLRNRDHLVSINGVPLPVPYSEFGRVEALARAAGELVLTVERDGKSIEMRHKLSHPGGEPLR